MSLVPLSVGYLDHAQPVARGDEAHRLGVDGDGTGREHAGGKIFFVEVDSHRCEVLRLIRPQGKEAREPER